MLEKRRPKNIKVSRITIVGSSKPTDIYETNHSQSYCFESKTCSKSVHNLRPVKSIGNIPISPLQPKTNIDRSNSESLSPVFESNHASHDRSYNVFKKKLLVLKEKNIDLTCKFLKLEENHKEEIDSLKNSYTKITEKYKKLKKDYREDKKKAVEQIEKEKKAQETLQNILENVVSSIEFTIAQATCSLEDLKVKLQSIISPYLHPLAIETSKDPSFEDGPSTARFINGPIEVERLIPEGIISKQAIVIKNYTPIAHGELELKLGEQVLILKNHENEFWLGKIHEKVGLFPSYCVMLD